MGLSEIYFGAFVEVEHQTSSLWWLAEIEDCLMMAGFKILAKWLQKSPENLLFLLITISRILPSNGKRLANNCARVKRSFLVMRTTIKQKNKPPQNGEKALFYGGFAGAPKKTRTSGLSLRRRTLYPTEL